VGAIFGESLNFLQADGSAVRLNVWGDERYARYETADGYSAIFDEARGAFCFATVSDYGHWVSSGVPVTQAPPVGLGKHLQENADVRRASVLARNRALLPTPTLPVGDQPVMAFGPSAGLLRGRRISAGSVRGLTILVNFANLSSTVTQPDVSAMLNNTGYTANSNFCSVRDYFLLVSNGNLEYTNDVVGPFTLQHPWSHYIENLLVPEAIQLAVASGVDLHQYDSRNEGIVDAISVMYAGQTQYNKALWPHNASLNMLVGDLRVGLYQITSMGLNAAGLSIGTFCHETGHMLCRFPDLYDYGERDGDALDSAGLGGYCLMSSGNHLNRGRTPSPICGYLRDLAGWCTEVDLSSPQVYQARHGDYGTVMKYHTARVNEYFIVENRSQVGLDLHLPSSGLAVYHCDTLGSNEWQQGTPDRHYQCALLQADGHRDLETNANNQGDGGDLYGTVAGTALSHATQPAAHLWDGSDSGLVISNVSPPGDVVAFTVGAPPPQVQTTVSGSAAPQMAIPDNTAGGISSVVVLDGTGNVRHIAITLEIRHSYRGDLRVELLSPNGRRAVLHNRTGGSVDDLVATYDSTPPSGLTPLHGQTVQGAWTLRVADLAKRDVGTLIRWEITATVGS
jgi:M6 family metalloprotease-like protein